MCIEQLQWYIRKCIMLRRLSTSSTATAASKMNPSGIADLLHNTEGDRQRAHWGAGIPSDVPLLAHTVMLYSGVFDIPPRLIALFSTP